MARNRHHNDNMKVTFSSHQFPEVSRVLKDSFNAPCSIHFNHAAKGHYSYLLLGDDDDVVTLTGKRLGRRSSTKHSTALLDYVTDVDQRTRWVG